MQIDINELIELVKSVKPMFLNHTEAEHVTVKGRADFVTQVDIRVQEYMRNELSKRWPDVQFMGEEKDNSDFIRSTRSALRRNTMLPRAEMLLEERQKIEIG